jgi:hypothetical protein
MPPPNPQGALSQQQPSPVVEEKPTVDYSRKQGESAKEWYLRLVREKNVHPGRLITPSLEALKEAQEAQEQLDKLKQEAEEKATLTNNQLDLAYKTQVNTVLPLITLLSKRLGLNPEQQATFQSVQEAIQLNKPLAQETKESFNKLQQAAISAAAENMIPQPIIPPGALFPLPGLNPMYSAQPTKGPNVPNEFYNQYLAQQQQQQPPLKRLRESEDNNSGLSLQGLHASVEELKSLILRQHQQQQAQPSEEEVEERRRHELLNVIQQNDDRYQHNKRMRYNNQPQSIAASTPYYQPPSITNYQMRPPQQPSISPFLAGMYVTRKYYPDATAGVGDTFDKKKQPLDERGYYQTGGF